VSCIEVNPRRTETTVIEHRRIHTRRGADPEIVLFKLRLEEERLSSELARVRDEIAVVLTTYTPNKTD